MSYSTPEMTTNDHPSNGIGDCTSGPPGPSGPSSASITISTIELDSFEAGILPIAQRITSESSCSGLVAGTLFPIADHPSLDPSSNQFDARKWTKQFYEMRKNALQDGFVASTGVAFKNLNVYGYGTATDFQKSVGNIFLEAGNLVTRAFRPKQRIDILQNLEGIVESGEMVAVLGPPGSGCSTFLKTIAGQRHGLHVSSDATINYKGIDSKQMETQFRGEAIYAAEIDEHFPHLTVGDTLSFAAYARSPHQLPEGVSRMEYSNHLRDVTMQVLGISHTKNTRVGDDFVRGVSGGERKRVTIAEAALSFAPLQCWDNSTRGLDSANAINFCKTLQMQSDIMGVTSFVAIYQAPQAAYDTFDKVLLLYEGRQIYFGEATKAQRYFEDLGFICPEQQTTADFLTSMTNQAERRIRIGWEEKVPRTSEDFANAWSNSQSQKFLTSEISSYIASHPLQSQDLNNFTVSRAKTKSNLLRHNSPFTLSYMRQIWINMWRAYIMLKIDPSMTLTMLLTNVFESLIIGSIFYNLPNTTSSFEKRGSLVFFIILLNAFGSALEIMTLYAKRKIVEKHNRYALYHPSAEALASMVVDLPYKIINSILMNTILYFMGNMRREPGPFFFFLLLTFFTTLTMSMLFRLIGSVTKSIAQAMAPAGIILLTLVLYTGYTIPTQYMRSWIAWARWGNPIFYSFESALLNEFVGRSFPCSDFVPNGPGYSSTTVAANARACTVSGSIPGEATVSGTNYILQAYGYNNANRWRNFGIIIVFMLGYMILHLIAAEMIASEKSKGEVLVFTRQAEKQHRQARNKNDIEGGPTSTRNITRLSDNSEKDTGGSEKSESNNKNVEKQSSIFHWKNVCYDIKIKAETRRILDHVDGWVKPGTLTALMGASGAGKTTLLDVLASRVTTGVISGDMLVDGKPR